MRKVEFLRIFLSFASLGLVACSSAPKERAKLTVSHDVVLSSVGEEGKEYKKGETFELEMKKPFWVKSEGRISALIFPKQAQSDNMELVLPKLTYEAYSPEIKEQSNLLMGKLFENMLRIQEHLARREVNKALQIVESIKVAYPEFTFINFFEATCYYLKRDYAKAQNALDIALKDFPENIEGNKLNKAIQRRAPAGVSP